LASADGTLIAPTTTDDAGRPVYVRPTGTQFFIVVEAKAGSSGAAPGISSLPNASGRPDLQIEANQDLGNGSTLVCDTAGPGATATPGGVPGIPTPSYDNTTFITNALVDFGCRFENHSIGNQCTIDASGNFAFASHEDPILLSQFCTVFPVGSELRFHTGDTLLTVRWRDTAIPPNLSDPRSIVVRVP